MHTIRKTNGSAYVFTNREAIETPYWKSFRLSNCYSNECSINRAYFVSDWGAIYCTYQLSYRSAIFTSNRSTHIATLR